MESEEMKVEAAEIVRAENVETASEQVEESVEAQANDQVEEEQVDALEQQPAEHEELSRESIMAQFEGLLGLDVEEIKEKAEQLKNNFYRLSRQTQEVVRKEWVEAGNAMEDFKPVVDELEERFRELYKQYKDKKAEASARREAELQQNLLKKENIIEQMRQMAQSDTDDVVENLQKMRQLREEWKNIGAVPPTEATRLWKEYNLWQEKFYDLVKINNELREYDFKKNLEAKNALIEEAEALEQNENIIEAFHRLQQLHDEWANIGPVARELREEIWNKFKEASTIINKRHQEHFEQLHAREAENEQKKQAIIDELKAIDINSITTSKQWEELTEKIQQLQQEWRKIGFASKKVNQQIYETYRNLIDGFFAAKSDYYKRLKTDLSKNLEKKQALIRHAEEWKNSTDWKTATDKIIKLQQEWKQTGQVARKYSDELWSQFREACNYFFEQKKAAGQDRKQEEKDNLLNKQAVLKQMQELEVTTKEETLAKMGELAKQFQSIGHVPFREKDKLMKAWHEATDKIFDQLHIDARNRRLEDFQKQVEEKDENQLMSERRRLMRKYEALQQEIKTAENNILFFTSNSKKSSKLVEDMQRKIAEQKNQLEDIVKRIELIDSKL
ncbi:MAG: DUF349 domain-containing protein [Paludibacteraceae bacterium]|nr:DUF349 domain-containing protein [Paludibacteraceae bacterium]